MAILNEIPSDQAHAESSSRQNAASTLRSRAHNPHARPSAESASTHPLVEVDPPDGFDEDEEKPLLDVLGDDAELPEMVANEAQAEAEPEDDELFRALILTVPFCFLYLLMDILVYFQYNHRPTAWELGDHMLKAVPTLGLIVFYTNRYPSHWATSPFLMSISILSGTRLIWLVNKAGWAVTTAQAPAVGTLWILTVVQLPLSRALIALAAVAGWTWYNGMKIAP